jgi:hypothetical protein
VGPVERYVGLAGDDRDEPAVDAIRGGPGADDARRAGQFCPGLLLPLTHRGGERVLVLLQVPAGELPGSGGLVLVVEGALDEQDAACVVGLDGESGNLDAVGVLPGVEFDDVRRRLVLHAGVGGGLHLERPGHGVGAVQDGADLEEVEAVNDADAVTAAGGSVGGYAVADGERGFVVLIPLFDLLVGVAPLAGAPVVLDGGDQGASLGGPVGDVGEPGVAGHPLLDVQDDADGVLPFVVPHRFDAAGGQGLSEGAGDDEVVDLVDHAGDGVDCPAGASQGVRV